MRSMTFGNVNTWDDWKLIQNAKTLTPPVPKTNYISVPGRDGDIDVTQAFSDDVYYESRTASFTYLLTDGTREEREELLHEIIGKLNGRKMRIIDEDDYPGYYMEGRFTVGKYFNNAAYGQVAITAKCAPWRYSLRPVRSLVYVHPAATVFTTRNRGMKTAIPAFTAYSAQDVPVGITFNNEQYELDAGYGGDDYGVARQLPEIRFRPGVNQVSLTGSGYVYIEHYEAIL